MGAGGGGVGARNGGGVIGSPLHLEPANGVTSQEKEKDKPSPFPKKRNSARSWGKIACNSGACHQPSLDGSARQQNGSPKRPSQKKRGKKLRVLGGGGGVWGGGGGGGGGGCGCMGGGGGRGGAAWKLCVNQREGLSIKGEEGTADLIKGQISLCEGRQTKSFLVPKKEKEKKRLEEKTEGGKEGFRVAR